MDYSFWGLIVFVVFIGLIFRAFLDQLEARRHYRAIEREVQRFSPEEPH